MGRVTRRWRQLETSLRADSPRQLAEFYRDGKADLRVMGAWSHSRLRETLGGGFTRHVLKSRSCNVLLAY